MTEVANGQSGRGLDLTGKRVLLVEDEYFLADDMTRSLRSSGAEVLGPFADVNGAMRCLEAETDVSAAILDINLRGEMIFQLADALAARNVPYVFSSGYERWAIPQSYSKVPLYEKPTDAAKLMQDLFG